MHSVFFAKTLEVEILSLIPLPPHQTTPTCPCCQDQQNTAVCLCVLFKKTFRGDSHISKSKLVLAFAFASGECWRFTCHNPPL